ncbi:MAG: DUF4129 domain-containing protein [Actinobacteria bacterium]|nr:DUF4129 domain-containing protein [Actinomycetota bacterium]MBU4587523.1 DUF4129 domain-containing protein [Actinomycetota bacterium]
MSPPLTPDADEARRQLTEELSKPIYADPGSWLLDVWNRVLDWLSGGTPPSAGLSTGQLGGIVLVAVVLAAIIVWSTLGPLQRRRRAEKALFADDERSASEVRADAVALAAAGDWTAAALAIFRAMIRTLAERGTIEEFGGMTAHEATDQAAVRLPDFADRLDAAAQLFDSLAYGRGTASAEQYQLLLGLDTEVGTANPTQVAVVAAPATVAVEAV